MYFWEPEWAAFRHAHQSWLDRHGTCSEVLYRLPQSVSAVLAQPLAYGRPILSLADQNAERDFDALCGRHYAEGVYHDSGVQYRHLRPPAPSPSPEYYRFCGFSAQDIAQAETGLNRCREIQTRSQGYIGRLVTDLTFRETRDELRLAWLALPDAERPRFPLQRAIVGVRPEGISPASPTLAEFQFRFEAFLDRYGLLSMATWELPDPAGPLLDGLPRPPHLLAGRPVQIAVPAHFHLQGTDNLQGVVQQRQRQQTQAAGINPSCIGPRSAERYAHLFAIDHFRRVTDGRYGRPPRPKGYVSRLNDALAEYLGIGTDHFRTLQRTITGLLRGRPHTGR
jgi:hypothetical protein